MKKTNLTLLAIALTFLLYNMKAFVSVGKNGKELFFNVGRNTGIAQQPKIITITNNDDQDLRFLDSLLIQKKIVLLGESSHGINEYSLLKFRFIKYLHEKLHFNTILFESGISECAYIDENKENLSPTEMLNDGLFFIWQTQSNVRLMQYIKDNNIKIYGIDNQYTSPKNSEYVKLIGSKIDVHLSNKIYSLDTAIAQLYFNKNTYSNLSNSSRDRFLYLKSEMNTVYTGLISKIDSALHNKNVQYAISGNKLLFLKKILQNKLYYVNTVTQGSVYSKQRDSIMGNNFKFIVDSIDKDSKIIVWAHNSHISKTGLQNPSSYLGKIIHENYSKVTYGIGLYAYQGESMENRRTGRIIITKPDSTRFEYYLFQLTNSIPFENKAVFQNFDNLQLTKENNWLTKKMPAFGWGFTPIIPIEEYDGVILIDRATAPTYIN
jgi:erythromycin esterase